MKTLILSKTDMADLKLHISIKNYCFTIIFVYLLLLNDNYMKVVKILEVLINIIFWTLVFIFCAASILLIVSQLFGEILPDYFRVFNSLLDTSNNWFFILIPISYALAFTFFILGTFYLKKSIKPMRLGDFYADEVIVNLKRAGKVFVFIGLATIIVRIISQVAVLNQMNGIVQGYSNSLWGYLGAFVSGFNMSSIVLLTMGLFFLLFSEVFRHAKFLKEENELTI